MALENETEPVCPHRFFFFRGHSQLSLGGTLIAELRLTSSPLSGRGFHPHGLVAHPVGFLAALTEAPVEALRTLFLDDLLSRPLTPDQQTGGLVDRQGHSWVVINIDGTREAARQRSLPKGHD